MSGKARLGGGGLKAPVIRPEDLDDNVSTYRVEEDGRSAEERVQYVRLDRIETSPYQMRRVFPQQEVEKLAESIIENGLVHSPKGRPHPSKPGWIELMPGEMRYRALTALVEQGRAEGVLKRDPDGRWLAPITVVQVDDERAEGIVFAENFDRTDLSDWEWALAWQQRRDRRRARGLPASLRALAAAHERKHSSIQDYPRIADALTLEVFQAAGVVSDGDIDHHRMAPLKLAPLRRIRDAAEQQGTAAAANQLLVELAAAGDAAAKRELQKRREAARAERRSFQINTRRPLEELTPKQAGHYLERMTGALPMLARRAAKEIEPEFADQLARDIEVAIRLLRER